MKRRFAIIYNVAAEFYKEDLHLSAHVLLNVLNKLRKRDNKYFIKYCEKVYERSGKNIFWSNNSGDILDKLKARDFNATNLSTYDVLLFTLRYLIIYLQINLLFLLQEPSIEDTLITLHVHVTTETHVLLRKKTKKISSMVLYVMRWPFCWTTFLLDSAPSYIDK